AGELPAGLLHHRKPVSAVPDADTQPIELEAVETDAAGPVGRKANGVAIVRQSHVDQPVKGAGERDVELGDVQDRLLYRNPARKRREVDFELAQSLGELIDVRETNRLYCRLGGIRDRTHSLLFRDN